MALVSLMGVNSANATVHIITAVGVPTNPEAFLPAITNANCGDTIKWVQGSGTQEHTAVSTTIPNGAQPWSSGTLNTAGFKYIVTKAGTYNYTCHPSGTNPAGHMAAKIVVTCATGVPSVDENHFSTAFPNPFSNTLTIEAADADIINLYNITGEKIKSVSLKNGETKFEINTNELTNGIYFYCIVKEGVIVETRKIVKN